MIDASAGGPRVVVFLTTGLMVGGAETMLLKLCSRLDRRRFWPVVVSLGDKGAMGPRIEALGVPVHALHMRAHRPSLAGVLFLKKLLRTLRPAVLQGWMYHGNLVASLVGDRRTVVWGIRQSLYDLGDERPVTRAIIRAGAWLSTSVPFVVYNSLTSARQHEAFGYDPSRTRLIGNGFDTDLFVPDESARSAIRRELGLAPDTVIIGLVARYHPMKDHATFLKASARIAERSSRLHVVIAGPGADDRNPELTATIAGCGLNGRVSLLGAREDAPRLTAALDIACSASAWGEGFPNVIGEAMSCGVPCVVTDVGDSARVVGDTGVVVPRRDPDAFAHGCAQLLSLGHEGRAALGVRARQRIIETFSLSAVVREYEALYACVMAGPRVV